MESMFQEITPRQKSAEALEHVCVYELSDGQSLFAPAQLVRHVLDCGRVTLPAEGHAQQREADLESLASLERAVR